MIPNEQITGTIFNVQRYCIHDGPGIRTTVFLKGCPMHCAWCENPESIQAKAQLGFYARQCIGCGECEKICPKEAIKIGRDERIDWLKCDNCGQCVKTCPGLALQMIGETLSVGEVVASVLRDKPFFVRSGGGATISGGEPTFQYDFLRALLSALKKEGIHTVLETNGFLPWEKLKPLIDLVHIFYFDLKAIDPVRHLELTGVPNDLNPRQRRKADENRSPGGLSFASYSIVECDPDSIRQMASFLDDIDAAEIHLLPYHSLGTGKIGSIHTSQQALSIQDMKHEEAEGLKSLFEKPGRKILVGGV